MDRVTNEDVLQLECLWNIPSCGSGNASLSHAIRGTPLLKERTATRIINLKVDIVSNVAFTLSNPGLL